MADAPALLGPVLDDLATVLASTSDFQLDGPTPCPDFTVRAERAHVLGWLAFFAAAANDPEGQTERPDPDSVDEPSDASAAAASLRASAEDLTGAPSLRSDEKMKVKGGEMPGDQAARLILWEYVVHGWDLAVATGQRWDPPAEASETSLEFAHGMLVPEYRGKDFGPEVEVPADATALDQLLGFSGRDPRWRPPVPEA